MLRHLSIRDFVIVAALDLEFDSGFTVFSGETGAGKSILIDALALALGARADASVVRTGEARADITAEFETHAQVEQWLDEQALGSPGGAAADDPHGSTVMLRRVVDANGRSRAFINGTAATLAQLREVGEMLVDIHGQHAHQLLMRLDAQRELFEPSPSPARYRLFPRALLAAPPLAKALARSSPASGLRALNGVHHPAPARSRACERDSEINSEFALA